MGAVGRLAQVQPNTWTWSTLSQNGADLSERLTSALAAVVWSALLRKWWGSICCYTTTYPIRGRFVLPY